ncbi:ABC transporter permease [Phycisphaeraceae bacterium D3-23]
MSKPATPELSAKAKGRTDIRARKSMLARATLQLFGRPGAVVGLFWVGLVGLLAVIAPFVANSHPILWKVEGEALSSPMLKHLTPVDVILVLSMLVACVLAAFRQISFKDRVWSWLLISVVIVPMASWASFFKKYRELSGDDDGLILTDILRLGFSILVFVTMLALAGLAVRGLLRSGRMVLFTVSGAVALILSGVLLVSPVSPPDNIDYSLYRQQLADPEVNVKTALFTLIPYSPSDRLGDAKINPVLTSPGPTPSQRDTAGEIISVAESQYGVRTYELKNADGSIVAIPDTIDGALVVVDQLWQAHQDKPGYRPAYGRRVHEAVTKRVDELAGIEVGERYHLMGTTLYGEDLCSRMIHGCRIALSIGFIATGIAVLLGVIIGGVLGYFASWADLIGLRLVEVFASIPVIMLLIMIVAFYGRNLYLMMVVLGLTGWVGYAYFIRAEFLKLRKMDYVMAARATGAPLHKILFQHMLPNGVAPVLVAASFGIAGAIRTEATLSFIGLGLVEEPSWGQMLDQARKGGSFSWWLATYPGLAIFLTIFAYNLIGEALRDVMDPRAVK